MILIPVFKVRNTFDYEISGAPATESFSFGESNRVTFSKSDRDSFEKRLVDEARSRDRSRVSLHTLAKDSEYRACLSSDGSYLTETLAQINRCSR